MLEPQWSLQRDKDSGMFKDKGCSRNDPGGVGCRHLFVLWGEGVLFTTCPKGGVTCPEGQGVFDPIGGAGLIKALRCPGGRGTLTPGVSWGWRGLNKMYPLQDNFWNSPKDSGMLKDRDSGVFKLKDRDTVAACSRTERAVAHSISKIKTMACSKIETAGCWKIKTVAYSKLTTMACLKYRLMGLIVICLPIVRSLELQAIKCGWHLSTDQCCVPAVHTSCCFAL